jgi:hypothetical protein
MRQRRQLQAQAQARDGQIEAEFEVHGRAGSAWRVTIVHEREVEYRGRRRISGASRSLEASYRMPDYSGADAVTARAAAGSRSGSAS